MTACDCLLGPLARLLSWRRCSGKSQLESLHARAVCAASAVRGPRLCAGGECLGPDGGGRALETLWSAAATATTSSSRSRRWHADGVNWMADLALREERCPRCEHWPIVCRVAAGPVRARCPRAPRASCKHISSAGHCTHRHTQTHAQAHTRQQRRAATRLGAGQSIGQTRGRQARCPAASEGSAARPAGRLTRSPPPPHRAALNGSSQGESGGRAGLAQGLGGR